MGLRLLHCGTPHTATHTPLLPTLRFTFLLPSFSFARPSTLPTVFSFLASCRMSISHSTHNRTYAHTHTPE